MLGSLFTKLGTDYNYVVVTYNHDSWWSSGGAMFLMLLGVAFVILMLASLWSIFVKAGRPGWSALIPVYDTLQLIWTVRRPWWWILLLIVPLVNIVVGVILYYALARAFGKGLGYTLLLLFLPFIGFPLLAWVDARYQLKKARR